ncbi:MAG: GNAT family N-acetyltransferase [Bacteroidetes bacterium]|nr:GNAT family N-acetyltransferase [Bacteroidota bacterium]MBS1649861.1 GNAT family N-acetyltransferase [Bacteroidota bacterium]
MNTRLNQTNWVLKTFETLTPFELYKILKLRSEVFVVEQNCVFLDMDNRDQFSYHLLGLVENNLAAYTRLIAAQKVYDYVSIGRVVTSPQYRKLGIGKELMKISIKKCYELFGEVPIKIGAQLYLKKFYESFGFTQSSQVYDEDGIDHIEMIKPAP